MDKLEQQSFKTKCICMGEIIMVLDLKSWTWSKVDAKFKSDSLDPQNSAIGILCASHSLISWDNKLLSVAGHTKDPSETITGDFLAGMAIQIKCSAVAKAEGRAILQGIQLAVTMYYDHIILETSAEVMVAFNSLTRSCPGGYSHTGNSSICKG
ncbi:hypothetical protein SAY86_029185 [Trapa natans]|uniref:Uncharacterized protein n=1 Tax=Trapa natans TaxID=22666 RepID=A0AAN7M3B2_TRANT|nr:hypothetical protein SAY86_029185 [Trapa natans]